jgi:hypothetical protein
LLIGFAIVSFAAGRILCRRLLGKSLHNGLVTTARRHALALLPSAARNEMQCLVVSSTPAHKLRRWLNHIDMSLARSTHAWWLSLGTLERTRHVSSTRGLATVTCASSTPLPPNPEGSRRRDLRRCKAVGLRAHHLWDRCQKQTSRSPLRYSSPPTSTEMNYAKACPQPLYWGTPGRLPHHSVEVAVPHNICRSTNQE